MEPKPLPDRVRPLEGAGMLNLFTDMGAKPKVMSRGESIVAAVCIVVGLLAIAYLWIAP